LEEPERNVNDVVNSSIVLERLGPLGISLHGQIGTPISLEIPVPVSYVPLQNVKNVISEGRNFESQES